MQEKVMHEMVNQLMNLAGCLNGLISILFEDEAKPETPKVPDTPEPPSVTLEQVRVVLAEKSQNGFTAEVRGLLEKHGAKKLSEINPGEFPALLAEAEALQ